MRSRPRVSVDLRADNGAQVRLWLLQLGADLSADVIPFLGHEISDEVIDLVIQRLCTYVPERTWREALRSAPR